MALFNRVSPFALWRREFVFLGGIMKKFLALIISAILCLGGLTLFGCGEKGQTQIKYADAPAIMEMLINDTLDYGLLPEPVITKLEKVKGKDFTWHRLDVQELYDLESKDYPQAVLMVKNEVLEKHPEIVREMKSKFAENLNWIKENPVKGVNAVKEIFPTTSLAPAGIITKDVVDACKIYWQDGDNVEEDVEDYIEDILDVSVGLGIKPADKPEEDFFFTDSGKVGESASGKTFTFCVPDGAPALAVSKFIYDNENFVEGATFNYNIVVADDIAKHMNGAISSADFIILPVNAGTLNYKKGDGYKMASVITHGNLYIVSKTESKIEDLIDKKIGVIGEGKVPDLTLKAVLDEYRIGYNVIA